MSRLITREGVESLRRRQSRDDLVEHYRWPLIVVGALGVGVANYIGLTFAGLSVRDALLLAGAVTVLLVLSYVALAVVTGARVVPVPRKGEAPIDELEPLLTFDTRAEAAEEATRRNMQLADSGEFWKAEPLPNGVWGLRHRRNGKLGDSESSGGWIDRFLSGLFD